jgi:hypothetical protein
MYIVIALYLAFLLITLVTALGPSLIGFGLTATGSIYYYYKVVKPNKKNAD